MQRSLYILIFLILIVSCKKEEEKTTYQVINNALLETTAIEYLDGSMYEIIVFHYSGDEVIHQDEIAKIEAGGGKSEIFDVTELCEKVKLSFRFLPAQSDLYEVAENSRKYLVDFTLIEKGKNNIVVLTSETMIKESLRAGDTEGIFRAPGFVYYKGQQ